MAQAVFRLLAGLAVVLLALLPSDIARADEATVAAASNFATVANELGKAFEAKTGHRVVFSFGSTGQLFAQILHGAPFDVFLAADTTRPEKAEEDGLGIAGTRFTYAEGVLVLWSADAQLIDGTPSALSDPALRPFAIANPATAPYGVAAIETMRKLGMLSALEPRLVRGKNISQAHQFVATGNAPMGFVALSQVNDTKAGSRWVVPEDMHAPLRQDAILLRHGRDNEAAKAFLSFLKSAEAVKMIKDAGYLVRRQTE
ncbi:MAG: molybdate ABC transporter substrate-binding protein [Pseudomonadota bacterium]